MSEVFYLATVTLFILFLIIIVRMAVSLGRTANSPGRPSHITITGGPVYIGANDTPVEITSALSGTPKGTEASPESVPAAPDSSERRQYPRQHVLAAVDYVQKGQLFKTVSEDVSDSGIFLKTAGKARIQVDDRLTLTFQDGDGTPRKHRGKIVRTTPEGMGIHFAAA